MNAECLNPLRRVLVVVPWLQGGGAQAALVQILNRVNNAQVTVVALFSGTIDSHEITEVSDTFIRLELPRTPRGVWAAARAVKKLAAASDVIYSLMRASHVVIGLSPRKILQGRTFIASIHQMPSADSQGLRGRLENILVRRALRSAVLVTAPSQRAVEEIITLGFSGPDRTRFEANIIANVTRSVVAPRKGRIHQVRLLFAGRLTPQKGLDRLPQLLECVETSIWLRIVGDGPDRDALVAMLPAFQAHHHVEFLDRVDDVSKLLDWADALFLPSRVELNPMTVWEARARGRGVIATKIPAFLDLAASGPVWLFEDSASLAQVVFDIADSEPIRYKAADSALAAARNADERSEIVHFLNGE